MEVGTRLGVLDAKFRFRSAGPDSSEHGFVKRRGILKEDHHHGHHLHLILCRASFDYTIHQSHTQRFAYCPNVYAHRDIVSPQMFISSEAPIYGTGLRAILVCRTLNLLLAVALALYYNIENRRRDRILAQTPPEVIEEARREAAGFSGKTDKEDFLLFRYQW